MISYFYEILIPLWWEYSQCSLHSLRQLVVKTFRNAVVMSFHVLEYFGQIQRDRNPAQNVAWLKLLVMKTENTRFVLLHNKDWRGFRCRDSYAQRCCFHQVFMVDYKLLLSWKQFNLSRNAVFFCHKASVHNWLLPFLDDKTGLRVEYFIL